MTDSSPMITDLLANKPGARRAARPIPMATDTDDSDGDKVTYDSLCRVASRPQMMIGFRKCSGRIVVRPYSMLMEISADDPNRRFDLQFAATKIIVEGEKLLRLFHYVCEHRVLEIREADRSTSMQVTVADFIVTGIEIKNDREAGRRRPAT